MDFADWDCVLNALEGAKCAYKPGTHCTYHILSFGWLTAAIVEKLSGDVM